MNILKCKKDFEFNRYLYAIGSPEGAAERAAQKPKGKEAAESLDPKTAREVAAKYSKMVERQIENVEEAFGEPDEKNVGKIKPYKLDRKALATMAPNKLAAKYKKVPSRILMALAEMASIQVELKKAAWRVSGEKVVSAGRRLDELNVQLARAGEALEKKVKIGDPMGAAPHYTVAMERYTRDVEDPYKDVAAVARLRAERAKGGESKEKAPAGLADYAADYNEAQKQYEALSRYSHQQLLDRGIIILPEGVEPNSPQAKKLVAQRKVELKQELTDLEVSIKRLARRLDKGKYGIEGNAIFQRSRDGSKYMIVIYEGGKYKRSEISYIGKGVKASDFNLSAAQVVARAKKWKAWEASQKKERG